MPAEHSLPASLPLARPIASAMGRPGETHPADGFFVHHGFWAPGVRLFPSIRFSSKERVGVACARAPMDMAQTQGVSQTAKAVHELDAVTRHNAALVEEAVAAAGSLSERAEGLVGGVAPVRPPLAG